MKQNMNLYKNIIKCFLIILCAYLIISLQNIVLANNYHKRQKSINTNFNHSQTDSKVKNYCYKEDSVYALYLHPGFQSHIVLSSNEEVKTISIAESYAFKINIVNNRIFIKALEGNIHTNMSIITNKHSYEFDVIVKSFDDNKKDIPYLIKFNYPNLVKKNQ